MGWLVYVGTLVDCFTATHKQLHSQQKSRRHAFLLNSLCCQYTVAEPIIYLWQGKTLVILFQAYCIFNVPEAYLMHCTYRSWFLSISGGGGGGGTLWKSRFFGLCHFEGHWKGLRSSHFRAQKSLVFSGPTPSNGPRNGFAHETSSRPAHVTTGTFIRLNENGDRSS